MRAKLDALHLGEASLQQFGSPDDVLIRLPQQPGGDAAQMKVVEAGARRLSAPASNTAAPRWSARASAAN